VEFDPQLGELPFPIRLEISETPIQLGAELRKSPIELRIVLGQPLFHLRVGTREVQLVKLAQIGAVGTINQVEPLHEFVGDVFTELLVQLER